MLRLIKHADYCALTSLDTGLDVAHVAYTCSLMYVHVVWSWRISLCTDLLMKLKLRVHPKCCVNPLFAHFIATEIQDQEVCSTSR